MKLVYLLMSNKINILFSNTVAVQVVLSATEWRIEGEKSQAICWKDRGKCVISFSAVRGNLGWGEMT